MVFSSPGSAPLPSMTADFRLCRRRPTLQNDAGWRAGECESPACLTLVEYRDEALA